MFYLLGIQLRSSDDETMMNKYLLKTEQAVLGLFCSGKYT